MIHAKDITRAVLIVFGAGLMSLGVNAASPRRIAWIGTWPSTYGADTAVVPPSYQPDDAPILRLDEATAKFQSSGAVFVDARDEEDYNLGHIPGAINFPFDYYDDHVAQVLPRLDKDKEIVTYCGGADCELSLYLARQLKIEGYGKISIFFGGFTSWQGAGLPMEAGAP